MAKPTPSFETDKMRHLEEVIRGRRTINLYLEMPVPDELIREAIDIASWAPNHHMTEPWRYYLMGKETVSRTLELLHDIVTQKKDAKMADFKVKSWSEKPGWLVMTCRRSGNELLQQEDYAACSAAAQNLMLYLWQAGIGTKWTSGDITRDPRFYDILGLDAEQEFVVGLFWYGYPKVTPEQRRTPVDEILTELP